MKEFEQELAILKGRVDGLEARVGELEATQFSTTTKLTGKATMTIGATSYGGDKTDEIARAARTDATSFSYRYTLNLNTSFTGKDLLYTRLRTGNYGKNAFSGSGYTGKQTQLETSKSSGNALKVDKIWYQFPIGDDFQAFVGPEIENYYMLAATPGVYKHVLKQFKLGGYYGAYGASTSPGFGLNWISNRNADFGDAKLKISANYVAGNGNEGNPTEGGLFANNSKGKFLSQIAYGSPQWQVSAAYAYSQKGMTIGGAGTNNGVSTSGYADAQQFNLNAYYQPLDSGWIPSISLGWSISNLSLQKQPNGDSAANGTRTQVQGWLVGLNWQDAFVKGNRLGFAAGQPQFVTAVKGQGKDGQNHPADGNYAFELYYDYQVTDNITVTPALFYLSRPFGEKTGTSAAYGGADAKTFSTLGGLVTTTFKF
jgi:hypothetical protein